MEQMMKDNYKIHTETQEEYNSVVSYYSNQLYSNYWHIYKDSMVVNVENGTCISYANIPFYKSRRKEVLSFTEWKQLTNQSNNNMKYVVEVSTPEEAYTYLKAIGNPYQLNPSKLDLPRCITLEGSHGSVRFHEKEGVSMYGPIVKFKDWQLVTGKPLLSYKANKKLKLTNDYTAEVDYTDQVVQVGCQTIKFSTVEELAKLIKE